MEFLLRSLLILLVTLTWTGNIHGNFPLLDIDTNMRIVLVPHDMPIKTTFYRIKATDSDHNFPLSFEVLGSVGKALISLEFLGCSEIESLCQANVFLNKPLDIGRTYEFQLRVTDTTGDFTRVKAAISATEGSAYSQSGLGPKIIMVPENAAIASKLATFVVVKNELNSRTVLLEIREPEGRIELRQRLLSNNRTECTLILMKKLDYETEPWFTFQLLAMNAHTDLSVDTRNVLVSDVVVGVKDVQDTPPIFTKFASYVEIPPSVCKGYLVTRVLAVDGDKQGKRLIRYGLLTDSNPFVGFFDLDPMSGEIHLKRNISELVETARPNEHINLSIMAEEIVPPTDASIPVRYSKEVTRTVQNMTFWINQAKSFSHAPMFSSPKYVGEIEENALVGAPVRFFLETKIWNPGPLDQSIMLSLEDIASYAQVQRSTGQVHEAFQIIPEEGFGNFTFEIRVARSELLDFEEKTIFKLQVRASSVTGLNSTSEMEIHIRDENDCKPVFGKKEYYVELPENSPPGTSLIQVHATDCDTTGNYGKLIYAQLKGSEAFHLNPLTGEISVDNPNLLDWETQAEIRFYVTATDGGYVDSNFPTTTSAIRNMGVAMVIVKVQDVNDSPPFFESKSYQAVLTQDLDGLKWPLQVKATDADSFGTPNAQIRYQVLGGDSHFSVDSITGDLRLKSPLRLPPGGGPFLGSVRIKAYDLGSPSLSSETVVEVFSKDVVSEEIQFLFPSSVDRIQNNQGKIEEMLSLLMGGQASIKGIRPYEHPTSTVRHLRLQKPNTDGAENEADPREDAIESEQQKKVPGSWNNGEKTVVTTRVHSPLSGKTRVFDLELLRSFMIMEDTRLTTTPKPEQPSEIVTGGSQSLFWILICLIVLLLVLFLIFLLCIFCPCCLYNRSNVRSRSSKTKIEKITDRRRESERESEVRDSRVQKSEVPVRKQVSTILEDGEDYNLGPNRFPRAREAWSGDERELRRGRTRIRQQPNAVQLHPAKERLHLQRQDISFEDWEQEQQPRRTETLPSQFINRADIREDMGTRWVQQQQQSYGGGGNRIGHAQIRRNEDTEQYFQDRASEQGGGNYGYHTGERRMVRQYSPLRSPPHSLPPAPPTAEYRIHSERHPNQRFFRTDVGEVLQFDFDGDEGKEMLMRRFIHDQKRPREAEHLTTNLETVPPAAYTRAETERPQIQQRNHEGEGSQRHSQGDDPTKQDKERRPRAAAGSRRHLLPSMETQEELVEEDEAPHHEDDKTRHRKDKGKHHVHKESREYKSHSKSKDRSRSRETDEGDEGPIGKKHKSKSPSRSRENSKSPLPLVKIGDENKESRDRGYLQSKSLKSKRSNEKLDSGVPARRSSSPVLISREIKMVERVEGRQMRAGSEDLSPGMGTLRIPDDLDGILNEEDGDDSGIGIVGVAHRSKMLEKKSVFTIAYDEMATQNVLRPDTAANNGS